MKMKWFHRNADDNIAKQRHGDMPHRLPAELVTSNNNYTMYINKITFEVIQHYLHEAHGG